MRCGTVRYGTKNMCLTTNILNCLHLSVEKYDSQQCRLFEDADSFIICADDTRKDALLLDRILRHILVLYAWVYLYVELNVSYTLFNNFLHKFIVTIVHFFVIYKYQLFLSGDFNYFVKVSA